MSRPGSVYLVGSGDPAVLRAVAARATHGKDALVAASFAPTQANAAGIERMTKSLEATFAGCRVMRVAVPGEEGADVCSATRLLEVADVIFVSGGDPVHGARLLCDARLDVRLREARARGAALVGVSAGSIALCAAWAEWDDDGSSPRLVRCAGVVDDLVVDCHDEASGWEELREVAELLRGKGERKHRFFGIPAGGALVVDAAGNVAHEGRAAFRLDAE